MAKGSRYVGSYAHSDIAFEFASWISAEFKMYVIKDYKRLKESETSHLSLTWNLHRKISKINYKIHTDAIQTYLQNDLMDSQLGFKYESEADMLNVALFINRLGKIIQTLPSDFSQSTNKELNYFLIVISINNYLYKMVQFK
nr:KilA-N domain-containing protein [Mycoplasmopsis canis]